MNRGLAVLIAWSAVGCLSAANVTVENLSKVIGAAVASHRSDEDTARRISGLELSERITEDTLALLQSRAPGPRTASTLEELMAQSAFLDPPPAERLRDSPPSLAEQNSIFERTINYVIGYAHRLPNLLCSESIVRFDDSPIRSMDGLRALGSLHFLDAIAAQVTYSQGEETVSVKSVDGKPSTGSHVFGIATSGEFGNTIISPMQPRSHTKASWSHWEMLHGKRLAVFHYSVAENNSQYVLNFGCEGAKSQAVRSAYQGLLFIEAETGAIVRITRTTVGLPAQFPTRQAGTAVEYGPVSIGGNSYMLPIRSATETDNPVSCDLASRTVRVRSLNEIRFSRYRLFQAESTLLASSQADKQPRAPLANSPSPVPPAVNAETASPELPREPELGQSTQLGFSLPLPPPFHEAGKPAISNDATFATHAAFRDRVSIVTVPLVVRDHEGRAIGGLTKDDFELLDNGKRQVITNFAEQRAPEGASPQLSTKRSGPNEDKTLPDRYVAFVFDDLHLVFGDLGQTRAAAERVLPELLDAGTRIAVLTTSGKLPLGFTNDRAKIIAALDRLRPNPIPHGDCPEVSYYMADRIVNANDTEALAQKAKEAVAKCGAPTQLPQVAVAMALSAARRSLSVHDYETGVTLEAIPGIALGMSVLPGERSLVFVSPGFYTSAGLPGMQEVIDRAARGGLVIQVLDARGLYAPPGFDAADGEPPSPKLTKLRYQENEQTRNTDVLAELAEATGGTLFQNSNDYDAGFRRLSERPSVLYLLGFSPIDDRANGAYHKLKVTVKGRKGSEIEARHGYIARTTNRDAAREAKEEIQNALWSRDEIRDIPMTVKSAELDANNGALRLNLLVNVDPRQVQFQRQDGRNRDKLTLTFGFFDADGGMVSVQGQDLPLDFNDSDLQSRSQAGLNIRLNLDVKPGSRFMRVVLRDTEGQMSTINEAVSQ